MKASEALKIMEEGKVAKNLSINGIYRIHEGLLETWLGVSREWDHSKLFAHDFVEAEWEEVDDPSKLSPRDVVSLVEEGETLRQEFPTGAIHRWRKKDGKLQRNIGDGWSNHKYCGAPLSPSPWEGEWRLGDGK